MASSISVLDAMPPLSPQPGRWNCFDVYTANSASLVRWSSRRKFSLIQPQPQLRRCLWIDPDPPPLAPSKPVPGRANHLKHVAGARQKFRLPQFRSFDVALSRLPGTSASHAHTPAVPLLQTLGSSPDGLQKTRNGNEPAKKPSLPLVTRIAVVRLPISCHAVFRHSPTNADL